MRRLVGVAALGLLLVSCTSHGSASPASSTSSQSAVSKVGETASLEDGATVTVLKMVPGFKLTGYGAEFDKPASGMQYDAAQLKVCVKSASRISSDPWRMVDENGGQYEPKLSVDGPTPEYPISTTLAAGECVSGWILFEVPPNVTRLRYQITDQTGAPYVHFWAS